MDRRENDSQSMIAESLTTIQSRIASVKHMARRQSPLGMAFAGLVGLGCERLGERVSQSRAARMLLIALPLLAFLAAPAAAQVDCGSGVLAFLGSIQTLTVESIGILLFVMIAAAGVLKACPWAGTNRLGNQILGGFLVAAGFYVLGPVVIDLADAATPLDMSRQCNAGGGGN